MYLRGICQLLTISNKTDRVLPLSGLDRAFDNGVHVLLFHFFLSDERYHCIPTTMKLSLLFAVVVSIIAVGAAPTRETNGIRMKRGLRPLPPVKRTSIRERKSLSLVISFHVFSMIR